MTTSTFQQVLRDYLRNLQKDIANGIATEHTFRPALKTCLESLHKDIVATNEPKRIECGAPDYVISQKTGHGLVTVGYIEAKDIGTSLGDIERDSQRANPTTINGRQVKRYLKALPNFVLTNYVEFRWYVEGEKRGTAELGPVSGAKLSVNQEGIEEVSELLTSFLEATPEAIASPLELARRMARLTHIIRDMIVEAFDRKQASASLTDLHQAFQQALIPDLSETDFADMFAQTLSYGLFAARVNHHGPGPFQRHYAANEIPRTNPFLRRIFTMIAGPDMDDEPFVGFVDDITQLLAEADMDAVLADFGKRSVRQDPVMHFYETFLAAYDPELRERRGVYYTPEPVVSYIVRSVDHLLRTRFDCPQGLADNSKIKYSYRDYQQRTVEAESHRVLLLDPACGTGTFLYGVLDQVREQYRASGNAGVWRGFVKDHLIKRLFGFELLMAPYAMAHLKLGMQLAALDLPQDQRADWTYDFSQDERLGVFLTNTLEQAEKEVVSLFGPLRTITEEANSAASVKRDLPIMVVLGNPPYSGHSANASWRLVKNLQTGKTRREQTWIGGLIQDYYQVDGKPLGEKNPKWLQDDYVKFIRFGQWRIQQTGAGVLAFVTNHGYLDNPTFRGMRQQLMDTFTDIYVLDLHGNDRKKEVAPDGSPDKNVFDIQQGVAIGIFVKEPGKAGPAKVHHADLWGERQTKYSRLDQDGVENTSWAELAPESPHYLFIPQDAGLLKEYERSWKVSEIFPVNSVGIVTARDALTIQRNKEQVWNTVTDFMQLGEEAARAKYNLGKDARDWKVSMAQEDLRDSGPREEMIVPIMYRPFDVRYTYYTGHSRGFICMPRAEVMQHMIGHDNLVLVCPRRVETSGPWDHAACSNAIVEHVAVSLKTIDYALPLYLYPLPENEPNKQIEMTNLSHWPEGIGGRQPNLTLDFVSDLEQSLGLRFVPEGEGDLQETFGPKEVFHYVYSILHAPTYRSRYSEFLKQDFPRVPITSDVGLFRKLVSLGVQLVGLHLMESTSLNSQASHFPITGDNLVEKGYPKYLPPGEPEPSSGNPLEQGRVYISKGDTKTGKSGQYFEGVESDVWEFQVGGYHVLEKWLRDRRGRHLSFDDLIHYQRIVVALQETMRVMGEIDEVIEEHGGWPLK